MSEMKSNWTNNAMEIEVLNSFEEISEEIERNPINYVQAKPQQLNRG